MLSFKIFSEWKPLTFFLTSGPILGKKTPLYQCNIKLMLLMFFTLLLTQFLQSVEAFLWLSFWSLEEAVNYSGTFAARIPKLASSTMFLLSGAGEKCHRKGINV